MAETISSCFNVDQHCDHEERLFTPNPTTGDTYLTKCPRDILIVRPILSVDPCLYVICMIRDPRDAIVSKHKLDPDVYWGSLKYWKAYLPYWRRIRDHSRVLTDRKSTRLNSSHYS